MTAALIVLYVLTAVAGVSFVAAFVSENKGDVWAVCCIVTTLLASLLL